MLDQWLLIALISLLVFSIRYIGLEWLGRVSFSPFAKLYFHYVPIAILTTLLAQQVLNPQSTAMLSVPTLLVCLSTGIVYFLTKHFLLSVILGVVCGIVFRTLLS
ncbi:MULTISPECIES: AzlD domain-containing protein [Shouchella]|uniref:AzlD domain-containing protein n=2 Tax=Shouchella TaxID=2893057 RepID=A0ABY7VZW8_9BACI|nr:MULTISPECIES: AzlD domain-containing protein [Shouchella]MED4129676.1 AzlD domain-containing protein [Shouchella miscanthi]WDF02257.1 AzlD domain-containing protein [Shouchella hunanensis]